MLDKNEWTFFISASRSPEHAPARATYELTDNLHPSKLGRVSVWAVLENTKKDHHSDDSIVWAQHKGFLLMYNTNMNEYLGLPIVEFETKAQLRDWLHVNHTTSSGIWVRVFKVGSNKVSASFEDLLDQGLCFGWSESLRHKGNDISYYQRFTPRKTKGTTSKRNLDHAQLLIESKEMTESGLVALGLKK